LACALLIVGFHAFDSPERQTTPSAARRYKAVGWLGGSWSPASIQRERGEPPDAIATACTRRGHSGRRSANGPLPGRWSGLG